MIRVEVLFAWGQVLFTGATWLFRARKNVWEKKCNTCFGGKKKGIRYPFQFWLQTLSTIQASVLARVWGPIHSNMRSWVHSMPTSRVISGILFTNLSFINPTDGKRISSSKYSFRRLYFHEQADFLNLLTPRRCWYLTMHRFSFGTRELASSGKRILNRYMSLNNIKVDCKQFYHGELVSPWKHFTLLLIKRTRAFIVS